MTFEPWLFTTDTSLARNSVEAGIKDMVIDWEWMNKEARQREADLECNYGTLKDLVKVKNAIEAKIICRINSMGPHTLLEVDSAIKGGADVIFLPMVNSRKHVDDFLSFIDDRAEAGVLIETVQAVDDANEIAKLPVDYIYVGLNDLALSRKSKNIFEAVADGTVENLRTIFKEQKFGFGGITLVDKGFPIPFDLLLKEMSRLSCAYGFLRRSFKKDIKNRDMKTEIQKIVDSFRSLNRRSQDEKDKDRQALFEAVSNVVQLDKV